MSRDSGNPYAPPAEKLRSPTAAPLRGASTTGGAAVRVCYAMETVAWAMVVFFGVVVRWSTLEANFPNRQMALNGELVFTCWAGIMMLLAIMGLVRSKGLLFRAPVAAGVACVVRLVTLVPMTVVMLIIAAAGFVA